MAAELMPRTRADLGLRVVFVVLHGLRKFKPAPEPARPVSQNSGYTRNPYPTLDGCNWIIITGCVPSERRYVFQGTNVTETRADTDADGA
jgi:hypothetical protein